MRTCLVDLRSEAHRGSRSTAPIRLTAYRTSVPVCIAIKEIGVAPPQTSALEVLVVGRRQVHVSGARFLGSRSKSLQNMTSWRGVVCGRRGRLLPGVRRGPLKPRPTVVKVTGLIMLLSSTMCVCKGGVAGAQAADRVERAVA
jgi:hypothetical protein